MAREGLFDDTGVEFEYECSAQNTSDCENCCYDKDTCTVYEEMKIEEEREEEEWNKYYNDTRF